MNVQTLSRPPAGMTVDQFFDWSDRRDERYELVDGVPKLQPRVKRNHNRIVVNVVAALDKRLDQGKFEVATGDFAIPTGPRSVPMPTSWSKPPAPRAKRERAKRPFS